MTDEPIWGAVPDDIEDAYTVEMTFKTSYAALRLVPRSWTERLFSWPWHPWHPKKYIIVPLGPRS